MKKNICILYGGRSQEHEVSCQSAASIFRFIDRTRYDPILIGIERNGTWRVQDRPETTNEPARGEMLVIRPTEPPAALVPGRGIARGGMALKIDFVFPVLHGPFGEDGTLQGLLELLDLPYAGAGVLGSALAMDKEKAKTVLHDQGIPIVEYLVAFKDDTSASRRALATEAGQKLGWPVFVKPACAGSSVGVSRAADPGEFERALERAFRFDVKVLVERAVNAREIECAVIGNRETESFPPGEIIPAHGFYSYEAKYLDPNGARLAIPAELPVPLAAAARSLAQKAYRALAVEGFARVDLFLERGTDNFYFNEINSIPGFTNISMFPRLCEAGGLAYAALIDRIIGYGFDRHKEKSSLDFGFDPT